MCLSRQEGSFSNNPWTEKRGAGQLREHAGGHIPGDLFALDLIDTCAEPGNYSDGDGTPASVFAAGIKNRLLDPRNLRHSTQITVDNARGLGTETVVSIFHEQGLSGAETVGKKNRVGGWALLRNYLDGAIHGDSKGLWISPRCHGVIDTLPYLMRDELRPEDINRHEKSDHHADALQYVVNTAVSGGGTGNAKVIGMW